MKTTAPSDHAGRLSWPRGSQERSVESFYQHGIEEFGDYHGGMLNFGLWKDGAGDYLTASRNLVRHIARSIGLGPDSRLLDVACGMGAQDVVLSQETECRSIIGGANSRTVRNAEVKFCSMTRCHSSSLISVIGVKASNPPA